MASALAASGKAKVEYQRPWRRECARQGQGDEEYYGDQPAHGTSPVKVAFAFDKPIMAGDQAGAGLFLFGICIRVLNRFDPFTFTQFNAVRKLSISPHHSKY